jgi:hypothetical protein
MSKNYPEDFNIFWLIWFEDLNFSKVYFINAIKNGFSICDFTLRSHD